GRHQYVMRLDVLMHQPVLVRVLKPPGELNGNVEDTVQGLLWSLGREPARADPVGEASPLDELGEDVRDAGDAPHIVTTGDVRMQAEFDPGFGPALEGAGPAGQRQHFGLRALDSEVEPPDAVSNAIDRAHTALPRQADHLVESQQHITRRPGEGGT